MKLKDTFMTTVMDDENILMEVGGNNFVGMVRSNESAAFIIEQLKSETTIEQITAAMCMQYDAPREVLSAGVEKVVKTLRSIHALEE